MSDSHYDPDADGSVTAADLAWEAWMESDDRIEFAWNLGHEHRPGHITLELLAWSADHEAEALAFVEWMDTQHDD